MNTSVEIIPAIPQDFLAIAALDREAWKQNAHSTFIPDGEHVWRIWCEHSLVFVAKEEDQVIGAILAFLCEDENYCLHKVFVANSHRGKGIGAQLFKKMLAQTDEKRKCTFLTVDPQNKAALALYKSWGYEPAEFVKGFYRAEEDRYVLIRSPKQCSDL